MGTVRPWSRTIRLRKSKLSFPLTVSSKYLKLVLLICAENNISLLFFYIGKKTLMWCILFYEETCSFSTNCCTVRIEKKITNWKVWKSTVSLRFGQIQPMALQSESNPPIFHRCSPDRIPWRGLHSRSCIPRSFLKHTITQLNGKDELPEIQQLINRSSSISRSPDIATTLDVIRRA